MWRDLDELVGEFDDTQWQTATSLPGWTVHDVISHLIGVESMLQGVDTPEADIDVSTLKHVRNDIGVSNERWVRKLRAASAADLARQFPRDNGQAAQGVVGSVQFAVERI